MSQTKDPSYTWQEAAAQKRAAVNGLIPQAWRLAKVPTAEEQPNVAGDYIRQFLTAREVEITETDALEIVVATASGRWKAKEVVEAFCHRAALGHQLVRARPEHVIPVE